MKYLFLPLLFVFSFAFGQETEKKVSYDFSASLSSDYRFFLKEGLYDQQKQHYVSLAFEPEFDIEWDKGNQQIVSHFFARVNTHDQERTSWDIRELYYLYLKDNWELSIGLKKIYWGVTESAHIIDVINQTDQVQSFDGEEKLGQPLIQFTFTKNWGTIDLFALPYHRRRTFPGEKGRLRFPFEIDNDEAAYESDSKRWHPGAAFRYSHYFSIFDVGLTYFYGNSREPQGIVLFTDDFGLPIGKTQAYYEPIHQIGIDLQATHGAVLWKFEGIYRRQKESINFDNDIFNFDAGFEYTFSNIANKGIDIGILGEYIYDNRGELAFSGLDNDIFVGSRLAFNDTQDSQILAGGLIDLEQSGKILSIEASRRFFQSWTAELEFRWLLDIEPVEIAYAFRDDSFFQFTLARYF